MSTPVNSAPIGVENLVVALLTDESANTYGEVVDVSPLINVKISPKVNTDILYADDRAVETVTSLGQIDVETETQDVPLEVQALILGHTLDTSNGVMTCNVNDVAPYLALGFKIRKGNGKYRYVWLLQGKFEELSTENATKEDKSKFSTPKLKATFITRKDGNWKHVADQDSAITPVTDAFLANVFSATLDLVAPTVTTVPLDAATGVLGTADIVFTFNKAIQSATVTPSNFFIMKADGTAIASTLSIGTNNTVVTINPNATLDAGAYIAIATTNITSASGISLVANSVINFTV